jgi:hypothetical protein
LIDICRCRKSKYRSTPSEIVGVPEAAGVSSRVLTVIGDSFRWDCFSVGHVADAAAAVVA